MRIIFSIAIFLPRVLMYQKRQISLPVGYKIARPKNRRLGTIVTSFKDFKLRKKQISPTFSYFLISNAVLYLYLANWLAHNNKMIEKSVFREAWSPEMTSQSFPVSCFRSRGFEPTGSEIWRFWYIKTRGRKIAIKIFFFAVHISTLRRFNRAKKESVLYTLTLWRRLDTIQTVLMWYMWYSRDSLIEPLCVKWFLLCCDSR